MAYYQSDLDYLDNNTIRAIEEYTGETTSDKYLYEQAEAYESISDNLEKVDFLEELADDLDLVKFKLTDIQEIIIAYMFVNDLFSKAYTDDIMELLDIVL
ncbi:hypothetical protein AVP_01 [Aerococcus phage vB_AviM_AVP]|nr:hypothetical protein AVP_01 [Aerococcus phage vB_AviM_AVP]